MGGGTSSQPHINTKHHKISSRMEKIKTKNNIWKPAIHFSDPALIQRYQLRNRLVELLFLSKWTSPRNIINQ